MIHLNGRYSPSSFNKAVRFRLVVQDLCIPVDTTAFETADAQLVIEEISWPGWDLRGVFWGHSDGLPDSCRCHLGPLNRWILETA